MAEFCRRCGAEIASANLMDIDPGVDRAHFALVLPHGQCHRLSPTAWRLFTALYQRHGRVVPTSELARAARIPSYALREEIRRLRYGLFGSRFQLVTHPSYGYELVVQEAQPH
jgi:DNA-binding response OmpR family regulator